MDKKPKLPAASCIFCRKSIEEAGGRRLVAATIGYRVSNWKISGGSRDHPFRSIKFPDSESTYLVVWGQKWTPETIRQALATLQDGKRPWFCQKCGNRKCAVCGRPLNHPSAADVLYDDGTVSHCMIIPADLGCINPKCKKYRDPNKS